jgi:hypothetical protein
LRAEVLCCSVRSLMYCDIEAATERLPSDHDDDDAVVSVVEF